ncbi:MAG: hypothetical protein ACSLFL_04990 [Alphaproteobacteria bacterium]
MNKKEKVLDDRVRRMAKSQGFTLLKNRQRDPQGPGYNTFRLEHAGTVLSRAASRAAVQEFLTCTGVVSGGVDRGIEIIENIVQAASEAGWRAMPPDGPCLPLADALPRIRREFSAYQNTVAL